MRDRVCVAPHICHGSIRRYRNRTMKFFAKILRLYDIPDRKMCIGVLLLAILFAAHVMVMVDHDGSLMHDPPREHRIDKLKVTHLLGIAFMFTALWAALPSLLLGLPFIRQLHHWQMANPVYTLCVFWALAQFFNILFWGRFFEVAFLGWGALLAGSLFWVFYMAPSFMYRQISPLSLWPRKSSPEK